MLCVLCDHSRVCFSWRNASFEPHGFKSSEQIFTRLSLAGGGVRASGEGQRVCGRAGEHRGERVVIRQTVAD